MNVEINHLLIWLPQPIPLRRIAKFFVLSSAISNPMFKAQRVRIKPAINFKGRIKYITKIASIKNPLR
jgi:hypothetical protein